jgi:hypothetical protein
MTPETKERFLIGLARIYRVMVIYEELILLLVIVVAGITNSTSWILLYFVKSIRFHFFSNHCNLQLKI